MEDLQGKVFSFLVGILIVIWFRYVYEQPCIIIKRK